MLKMLECPYCKTTLELMSAFSGCDWDCAAGEGSGYGWEISLTCQNDDCATNIPLMHTKEYFDVSVVVEKRRHFINRNIPE